MPESISEFLQKRGSLAILTLLTTEGGQRFTDLDNEIDVSTSTLTKRLGVARDLGLVIPGQKLGDTSVGNEYRITDRGQMVARQMERQGIVHRYRTIMENRKRIDEEMGDLVEWVDENQEQLAGLNDREPYQDRFGEGLPGLNVDEEPEYPDEYMIDSGPKDDDSTDEDEVPEELQPYEVWGEEPDEDDDDEDNEETG